MHGLKAKWDPTGRFNPAAFQGVGVTRRYFEGWYFKHVDAAAQQAIAIIPGVSYSADGSASHFLVRAFAAHPAVALAAARRVLGHEAEDAQQEVGFLRRFFRISPHLRQSLHSAHARMARITAVRVLAALGTPEASATDSVYE